MAGLRQQRSPCQVPPTPSPTVRVSQGGNDDAEEDREAKNFKLSVGLGSSRPLANYCEAVFHFHQEAKVGSWLMLPPDDARRPLGAARPSSGRTAREARVASDVCTQCEVCDIIAFTIMAKHEPQSAEEFLAVGRFEAGFWTRSYQDGVS